MIEELWLNIESGATRFLVSQPKVYRPYSRAGYWHYVYDGANGARIAVAEQRQHVLVHLVGFKHIHPRPLCAALSDHGGRCRYRASAARIEGGFAHLVCRRHKKQPHFLPAFDARPVELRAEGATA